MAQNSDNPGTVRELIENGQAVLGVEFGSTRIKASLITPAGRPLASGSYEWENQLKGGVWTYDLDTVWDGAAACFEDLVTDVHNNYEVDLTRFAAGGFSGMMHGYLAFDKDDNLLVPFRTWRNNITEPASKELTELFQYPIPQRWSIAHLYQAILNGEEHVSRVAYLTTLAGYVHWKLTGEKAIGVGEASGMFPVDPETQDYDASMIETFDRQIGDRGFEWKLRDLLPRIVPAGEPAGTLSGEGALLLDPSGQLQSGTPLCPPEGDAGTGMIATNSIRKRTGNVSAGTSVFAMLVLEKPLSKVYPEIDLIVTPDGNLVGMAHSNNCTSDIDAWIRLFGQVAKAFGVEAEGFELYTPLFSSALEAEPDAGGLLNYGYVSGEHITGFPEGRPLFARSSDAAFSLENFMRSVLFTSLCALRTGLNILYEEGVVVEELRGHGGFFKTPEVGQRIMAAATKTAVSLLDTAGEGGSWGMALLAAYTQRKDAGLNLPEFLDELLSDAVGTATAPSAEDIEGFERYFQRYHKGLSIERAAVDSLE